MTKTIQVRIDDQLKESADALFTSLGLDTSTAVRMFLIAAIETEGIPFVIAHGVDRDTALRKAINRRKAGAKFFSGNEFLAHMKNAVAEGAIYAEAEV